ncbi:MAG: septal ring lytic transglycosylase RlpA family protein [Candidatus Hydrogenedentes bacterium]|nr:septal ring lytic transglycosylase RlpA family protein [Candidatus Hydrogenedentota bacterium]
MFSMLALLILSSQPLQPCIEGIASYYTVKTTSKITASGETLIDHGYTCAMPFGKFGDYYLIVNEANGKAVICRLNDRGPFVKGRVVDLTFTAMRALDKKKGLIRVKIYHLGSGPFKTGPINFSPLSKN